MTTPDHNTVDLHIRILEPDDRAVLESYLLPRLESSMFLISNLRLAGIQDMGKSYEGTYAAAFVDERIVGVIAHYCNDNLIFQSPAHLPALLRLLLATTRRPVKGMVGPAAQVAAAKQVLQIAETSLQLDETDHLYALDLDALIVPGNLRSGDVRGRRVEPRDLDLIAKWRVEYSMEELRAEDTPELRASAHASMERSIREGSTWILEQDGVPVAMSSFNAAIAEAVQIGGVWTPPPLRGHGYGRAVVAASLQDARSEGKQLATLFTGVHNIPAQKAYLALGFRQIGDYSILILRYPGR